LPRPREPRFHGSNGDAERIRNFLVAEAVNFSKDDRGPLIERQPVECRLQPFCQLFLREYAVRAGFDARPELAVRRNMDVERDLVGAVAPTPESMAIAGLVDGDPVNPGAQGGLPAEAGDGAKDAKEDFLREIERFVAVAKEVDGQLNDHALVLRDELREGHFITGRATLNEGGFAATDLRPPDGPRLLHGDHSIEFRPRLWLKVPEAGLPGAEGPVG